jgi:predicted SAM-dependent methyltransferase
VSQRDDAADASLPPGLLEERGDARLHIGGWVRKPGWQVLNIQPGEHVDHLGDLRDLSRFADASFDMVYASHVFEHLGHRRDVAEAFADVARIVRPGVRFFVGVPDLKTLCWFFVHREVSDEQRQHVMHMMYGDQSDEHNFHYTGFWDSYLASHLKMAGFSAVYRVETFGLFDDTSEVRLGGTLISLNMVAVK